MSIMSGGLTDGWNELEKCVPKVVWDWKDTSLKKCCKYGWAVSLLRKIYLTPNEAELNQLLSVTCDSGISLSRKQSVEENAFPLYLNKNFFSLSLHCPGQFPQWLRWERSLCHTGQRGSGGYNRDSYVSSLGGGGGTYNPKNLRNKLVLWTLLGR